METEEIAASLGVTKGAVSQCLSLAKEQGVEAVKYQPAPGATPKLTTEQMAQLAHLLGYGAEAFGFM